MARISTVYTLPPLVRQELTRRLLATGFGNYQNLEAWLAEQGYAISKSALHRFGTQLRDNPASLHTTEIEAVADQSAKLPELRMRCIESAAMSGAEDVLDTAQGYLNWVLGKS